MTVFVDTSALYALLDRDDRTHARAKASWMSLLSDDPSALVTTSYVLVETAALVQRRLGLTAVRALVEDIRPVIRTIWVDEALHDAAEQRLVGEERRGLSFVDCASFEAMARERTTRAFAFDRHFAERGFGLAQD